jgi:hypothetical protein
MGGKRKQRRSIDYGGQLEHRDSRLRNEVEITVNIYRALRMFAYFHKNSIHIIPMLATYVTTQSAVRVRQIMLWEQNPVNNIAEMKYMRAQKAPSH